MPIDINFQGNVVVFEKCVSSVHKKYPDSFDMFPKE